MPARTLAGTITGLTSNVTRLAFSPDGKTLATISQDTVIRLWNTATLAPVATLSGPTGQINAIAFDPAAGTLYSASADDSVLDWNLSPAAETARLCRILREPGFTAQWRSLSPGIGPPPCRP